MVLSIQEAYNILDLRKGASADEVVNSYKRLALEWHPDRHNQSELSFEKFSKINNAFRRLTTADDKEVTKPLAKEKMFQIFEDVYIKKMNLTANINKVSISSTGTKNKKKEDTIVAQLSNEKKSTPLPKKVLELKEVVTSEDEDEKDEEKMAAEEERRKSAEKRRAKKKRRKEAKKLEKELLISQAEQALIPAPQSKGSSCRSSRSSSIDTDSSEKINSGKNGVVDNKLLSRKTDSKNTKPAQEVKVEVPVIDPLIAQSRRLATRGNELASDENFIAAVELYSEAIRINTTDFRFFGNRSYCYDKLGKYKEALEDAERAIHLNPDWSKNYHRKGRALAGLKKYTEAEAVFERVLQMDKDCSEAKQELYTVRLQQLMEMGFTKLQAETAILQHKSVSAALDALLQAPAARAGAAVPSNDVYFSDDENQAISPGQQLSQKPQQLPQKLPLLHQKTLQLQQQPITDIKLDPSNPEGLNSLWVGNISKDLEESALKRLFSPFGTIVSIKKKPETYYAFVEFADKASCGQAMRALQGVLYGTQKLYIRFPGKTGANGHPNNNPLILRKSTLPPTTNAPTSDETQKHTASSYSRNGPSPHWSGTSLLGPSPSLVKMKGPVNGNECYFWRTTGCSYGDNCKFKHIQANKGIDRKPWQTVTA